MVGGWRRLAVGSCRLAVGGGWWRMAVGSRWSLGAVLNAVWSCGRELPLLTVAASAPKASTLPHAGRASHAVVHEVRRVLSPHGVKDGAEEGVWIAHPHGSDYLYRDGVRGFAVDGVDRPRSGACQGPRTGCANHGTLWVVAEPQPGMCWKGGGVPGAQPTPSHCPPDAKCRPPWHL